MVSKLCRHLFPLALMLALAAGCDRIPSDPDGTLERVRTSGQLRVGIVAGGERVAAQRSFVADVASATGSVPVVETASAEDALARLERGELDLVVGEFHVSSPWLSRVSFVPPLSSGPEGDGEMVLRAAAPNGENAWIALLHDHRERLGARP